MPTAKRIGYVAGPYRDPRGDWFVQENIERARRVGAHLWSMRVPTIIPHVNTAHMSGIVHENTFLEGLLGILERCDFVVLFSGSSKPWYMSTGTTNEIFHAYTREIPVFSDRTDLRKIAAYAHGDAEFSSFFHSELVKPQWCERHAAPASTIPADLACQILTKRVMHDTAFRTEIGFDPRDKDLSPEQVDDMNRALYAIAPLCCMMGDDIVSEVWGQAHEKATGGQN